MAHVSGGRSEKRAEQVARAIEDRIVELGWPVGHLIGSEQSLMEEHDASRGVLREAVRLMEHHGTARMRRGPGGGLVVDVPSAHAVRRSASLLLQYQRTDLASLVAARTALELTCFDLAAERFGNPLVNGRLLAALRSEDNPGPDAGRGFHATLIEQADNQPLALFAATLIDMQGEAIDASGEPRDLERLLLDEEDSWRDHAQIYAALATGDKAQARDHLERHLERLGEATLARVARTRRLA